MKLLLVAAATLVASVTSSFAQQERCVTSGRFSWGSNSSWSGTTKAGQACRASFSSDAGSFQSHRIVTQPKNGSLRISGVSNGVPTFVYQPKAGFSGSDTFTVELTGAGINRQTGTTFPPASTLITYNMAVTP
jgi:hypothetical protein